MQAFMVATIKDHLSIVDAQIDAYEVRVQQSLSVARSSVLMAL